MAIYAERYRERKRAYDREYKRRHPEVEAVQVHRRRTRKITNGRNDLTLAQWRAIKSAYRNCCAYCGEKSQRLTMDHVIPLARGGEHTATNVVPACKRCNTKKSTRPAPSFQPVLVIH